jgi:hypothetical protein
VLFVATLLLSVPSAYASKRKRVYPHERCQMLLTDHFQVLEDTLQMSRMRNAVEEGGRDTLSSRFGQSLTAGMRLLVSPLDVRFGDGEKLFRGRKPIRFTVLRVRRVSRPRGPTYVEVLLNSPETGQFWVPHFVLVRHLLNDGPFKRSTLFASEEQVMIGTESEEPREFQTFDGKGTIRIPGKMLPLAGRFKGLDASGAPVVEVQIRSLSGGLPLTLIRVRPEDIQASVTGTENKLSWQIRRLFKIRPALEPGEAVRYRGEDGVMRPATFIRLLANSHTVEIRTAGHRTKRLPRNQVFKMLGPEKPRTPYYSFSYVGANFEPPCEGILREFLDGAALIVSHPDFWEISPRARVDYLTRYVELLIPWTKAGRQAEIAGLKTYGDITASGIGVCRHSSTLLAVILAEAGVTARIMEFTPPGKGAHQWVEADIHLGDGTVETWILDAAPGDGISARVLRLSSAELSASIKPESTEALYYANPARRVITPL